MEPGGRWGRLFLGLGGGGGCRGEYRGRRGGGERFIDRRFSTKTRKRL